MFNGQALQDKFVLSVLKNKKNGYFLEIGSNHPIQINNTYILENEYNWKGLMVEYDKKWENEYKKHRNSNYIIADATTIDYKQKFEELQFPPNMDYLQIDLEVNNGSTINTLENLNINIFPYYKFAVVTFEHDIYRGDYFNTRNRSREIFDSHGYFRVYSDVKENSPYEDWYVHPELVDMNFINKIKLNDSLEWKYIMNYITIIQKTYE